MEMDSILTHQNELYGRIARAVENLKKTHQSKWTTGILESRIQVLDTNWRKFEDNHDQLRNTYWTQVENKDYAKKDYYGLVEETYLLQRGSLTDALRGLSNRVHDSSTPSLTITPEGQGRRSLPRIQLPTFSGSYEDWPPYRDLFRSLVLGEAALSKIEKFHYLKTSLKGEAKLLVKNFSTTAENFEHAWKALTEQYENTRLVVRSCLSAFTSQTKMKFESAADLRRLFHTMLHTVGTLKAVERPIGSSCDLFVHIIVELLDSRTRRDWETGISDSTNPPSYDKLKEFLECRMRTLEALQPSKTESAEGTASQTGGKRAVRAHVVERKGQEKTRCLLCQKDHYILFCPDFRKKDPTAKKSVAEKNQLCLNCFGRHTLNTCQSKKPCIACGKRHHTSIHDVCSSASEPSVTSATSMHISHHEGKQPAVLLATALVDVADRFGVRHTVRVLVDPCSEISIALEALAQRLRIPRAATSVHILGVGALKAPDARGHLSLTIFSRVKAFSMQISALVLLRVTAAADRALVDTTSWPHIQKLSLADPDPTSTEPVELLIGVDVYAIIIEEGLRKGEPHMPVAQQTSLGWILSGRMGQPERNPTATSLQCRVDDDLNDLVRQFWEQEELLPSKLLLTDDERRCEKYYQQTVRRMPDGRYVVRLPLRSPRPQLNETRHLAVRIQTSMERRFKTDPDLKLKYKQFMQEYEELGHMTLMPSGTTGGVRAMLFTTPRGVEVLGEFKKNPGCLQRVRSATLRGITQCALDARS